MRAFTIIQGAVVPGIAVRDGAIDLGFLTNRRVCVPLDPRSTVRDGRLVEAPGRGALLLIEDHAGVGGTWHVRAAQPAERWDAMVATESIANALDRVLKQERIRARFPHRAPAGWHEFARGDAEADDVTHRRGVRLYGYVENGAAFEIRRRGRLDRAPAVFRVACDDGNVTTADPRAEAIVRAGLATARM